MTVFCNGWIDFRVLEVYKYSHVSQLAQILKLGDILVLVYLIIIKYDVTIII